MQTLQKTAGQLHGDYQGRPGVQSPDSPRQLQMPLPSLLALWVGSNHGSNNESKLQLERKKRIPWYPCIILNNNRRLVTLAEHTSDHGKQTNSSTDEKGEQG